MPYATNDGVRLYWEADGSGEPLLLIQGLGFSADMWFRVAPGLSSRRMVIRYDARGIGRSDVPPGPYPIEIMASDAVAVLDAAGVDRAHVLGVSLGGIVAQEVALGYPGRVCSLVLGCTHTAGPQAVWPEEAVIDMLRSRATLPPEESARASIPFAYASAITDDIEEDIRRRLEVPTSAEGYQNQLLGGINYRGTAGRLAGVGVPALVLTGDKDQMVPPENSAILARTIPNARLVVIPNAGHVVFTDDPEAVVSAVNEFLDDVPADEYAR
jgi:pimeloyl-ACP methyl ester carboxylesterase